jgi:hypothetical protein
MSSAVPPRLGLTLDELNGLPLDAQIDVFLGLPAPAPAEFHGEFEGHTPAYQLERASDHYLEEGLGRWSGKGCVSERYRDWSGHGYNIWDTGVGRTRRTRFGWKMGRSALDGRECLLMHYRAFANVYADIDLVDEIRRVDDGLYLGIVTTKEPSSLCPHPGGPDGRAFPSTFVLRGPVGPWVGPDDPSTERREPA